ncbi:MAG: glutamate 5-kinase [Nitrososphaerota archaeon]|nr:glutamate 5-kinase [Candidatus Bathyarchaeota archaeon]MDW8049262.1 glutamate 5-kinase [Nitrososphaerota archaeon]
MAGNLVVVKVGTRCLTTENGALDLEKMGRIVDQIAQAVKKGYRIIFVTSGAIASGIAELGVTPNPNDIVFKQACAAVGQSILMSYYREMFRKHGLKIAQILLTENDLSNRVSYLHICNVLDRLLSLGVVPIINENDVTSISEIIPVMKGYKINFSDNDILSVLIANATNADLVIILSTVDGLYTKNPNKPGAELIRVVEKITPEIKEAAEGKGKLGRGGMKTKLQAAEIAMQSGIPLVIANSEKENVILDVLDNKPVGTYFIPSEKAISGIEKWIAYGATVKGNIYVNDGAKKAILNGASLLAVGVEKVEGSFQVGDVVSISGMDGKEFARGITNYTSEEINLIKGMNTTRIRKILGYLRQKEIVTRKRMHLMLEEAN